MTERSSTGIASSTAYRFGSRRYEFGTRTFLMGVLNVTPDSFSDGGRYLDPEDAVRRGLEMAEDGADFIDVGGESSRPGSLPVDAEEEIRRTVPVIERLARATDIPVSIDTVKSAVAARALDAGAVVVNDISGLQFDPSLADIASKHRASVVLMHMRGSPRTMQDNPVYDDVMASVKERLSEGIVRATASGIDQIFIDPGIGFGKSLAHNTELIRRLGELRSLGYPVLVGPSRKSFIGAILDLPVERRLEGTAGAVAVCIMNGADVVRVHDIKEMKHVAGIVDAIVRS